MTEHVEQLAYRARALRRVLGASFRLTVTALDVASGETLALLGPTGAGKSTLLRLLAGLDSPTDGELCFRGEGTPADLPLGERRRITLVHQRPVLLSGSVRYNVAYGLKVRGIRERQRFVDPLLAELGLAKLADQAARTLSGGQTQLVAIARALAIEPEVLLLDEPTSHLDPGNVARVEEVVQRCQQERATTIVWATHNLFQARRVAHRSAWLLGGQLIEAGETEALFERPKDPRTADFLQGRMVY